MTATGFVERGPVAFASSYLAGDVIWVTGRRVLIQSPFTIPAGLGPAEPWVSPGYYLELAGRGAWPAAPYGVSGDGLSDSGPALNALITRVSAGGGGTISLPAGYILSSQTTVIQPNVTLVGQGRGATTLRLMPHADCDVVQFSTVGSTTQAAITGLAVGALRNCFYGGLRHLTVHGSSATQTAGTYHHGVNATTNPTTAAWATDPDFDPKLVLTDVWLRSCTGDGYFHKGRSGALLSGVVAQYNGGNGFSPSFDTKFVGCDAGMNGIAGWYFNWSSVQATGCKSFNNGKVFRWDQTQAYQAGQAVIYGTGIGALYTAIAAAPGIPLGTVAISPDVDPNWTAVVGVTSLHAWGTGAYLDVNCAEFALSAFDAQQNSGSSFYVRGFGWKSGGSIAGSSAQPNFNNQTSMGGTALTNPGLFAGLVLDGARGINVQLSMAGMAPAAYPLRLLHGSVGNDVTLTGETTAPSLLSPDTTSVTGNAVRYNGTTLITSP